MTESPDDAPADKVGLQFGSVAARYERFRRNYDDDVFSAVSRYAARPLKTALEIGAGTGKATRLFAGHGVHVVAIEPDGGMVAYLDRATRNLPVTIIHGSFESFTTDVTFDLVFAAAAWHWTDPASRWSRAVQLLDAQGTLALFGSPGGLTDTELAATIDGIETEFLGDGAQQAGTGWTSDDVVANGFADVWELRLPSRATVAASHITGRLSTVSAYLALDPAARDELLTRVASALPERVEIDTSVQLTLARRT